LTRIGRGPAARRAGSLAAALLLLASAAGAAAREPGCMERHLLEAAALNEERLPLYSVLTDGRSEPISRRLIRFERMGLGLARQVDRAARRYQAAGIPVVCADFVEIADTPPFAGSTPPPPAPPPGWRPPTPAATRGAVQRAYRRDGITGVADELRRRLRHLEDAPGRWCMTRHMLESAARIAWLAPEHAAAARAANLRSPLSISADLIEVHLLLLGEAARLDRMALPLQQAGVPILCGDVPAIEYGAAAPLRL
jgi:hypothetical protein